MSSFGYVLGKGQATLRRVAAGWTDADMLTVRRMAANGATAAEIGDVLGWKPARVVNFIRSEKLVWNQKTDARHATLAAASRSNQGLPVDTSWRPIADRMHAEGASNWAIAKVVGRSEPTVRAWLIKSSALTKPKIEKAGM